MRVGARLCHLMASASSHNITWLKMDQFKGNQIRRPIRRQMKFNAHLHRDEVREVLFMASLDFNLTVCAPFHYCCRPPAGLPCRSSISGILHRRWATLHTYVGGACSQTGSCSSSFFQIPGVLSVSRHSPFGLGASVLSPGGLTMVRHRMISHRGGNRGGNARTRPAPAVAQPVHIGSPPSSQSPSPASSPDRNPFPHNTPQYTTHFQFQSRLNQPIITANITIFFSEEEFVERPPARNSGGHPQDALGEATGPGSGQTSTEDGKAEGRGTSHAEEGTASVRQAPESNAPVVNMSMEFVASSSGNSPVLDPPGGSGLGDMERDGVN